MTLTPLLLALGIVLLIWRLFVVPSHLRHIPCAPVLPLLKSYLSGEVEEQRIRRIILPFALENGHSVVLVWLFGHWFAHIVDPVIGKEFMEDKTNYRQLPPRDMLFWQFTGRSNIFFTEGEDWKRHSRQLKQALQGQVPMSEFVRLSKKTLQKIDEHKRMPGTRSNSDHSEGVVVRWDELLHRFTLDVVGVTVLGYDFQALDDPDTPFVNGYRASLDALTSPAYVFIPKLEKALPRHAVRKQMFGLRAKFREIIEYKRNHPGDDLISHLTEDRELGTEEMVDNVVVLFIAGHDTTAAALASLIYFLAKHPIHQVRARSEVRSVLGHSEDPTIETLARMPYLSACIKESLRMNNPSNFPLPRISRDGVTLAGNIRIPPGTPVIFNVAAVHRNDTYWNDAEVYDPTRFLNKDADASIEAENRAWFSFGAGHRQCPAQNFSLYEQRVLTALLLREYEWSLPQGSVHSDGLRNRFTFSALNSPADLDINFKRISK